MSLLSFVRNSSLFFRKEVFSTSAIYKLKSDAVTSNDTDTDTPPLERHLDKDRSEIISPETSILYMESNEYKETYGEHPVWKFYRRNFKGNEPPKTRRTCISNNKINNSSPCPICRDKYLILDYRNIKLIEQFIAKEGQYVIDSKVTGICQKQHKNLLVAVAKAKDYGFITFDVPFRYYNYNFYK